MLHRKQVLLLALILGSVKPSLAMELSSYRAVYELEPTRIEQGIKVTPIDGRLAYEVTGSNCLGWTVTSDLLNRSTQQEAGLRMSEIKSHSFETPDGLRMSVSQQEIVNDRLVDDQEVKAIKPELKSIGKVALTGSKTLNFDLAAEAIYPTQHQQKLLDAASRGEVRDVSIVYDGSDGSKQFRVVTFIGKKRPPTQQKQTELADLSKLASWSFQLGYYSLADEQAESPDFQATFNMFENGVSSEMLFDYGSYAMKAKISKFENLATPPCDVVKVKPQ